jgi:hypothetical protein
MEICTISLGGLLDDDYTFHDNGKILHYYDRNSFDLSNRDWITAKDISSDKKKRILEKCPEEFKKRITDILGANA